MTIAQIAKHYTATDSDAWARHVAAHLGVTTATTLRELTWATGFTPAFWHEKKFLPEN